MSTYTATADDRRTNDLATGGMLVGDLQVSDLGAAGWGVSWEPDTRAHRAWQDTEHEHPPDEQLWVSSEEWDVWPIFERFGPSRRLLVGI